MDQAFGGPAAEADGEGVGQVPFPVQSAVVGGQRLGQPEGLPGAQHGDPADRVGVRGQRGDQGVTRLVDGDAGEFAGGQRAGAPGGPAGLMVTARTVPAPTSARNLV